MGTLHYNSPLGHHMRNYQEAAARFTQKQRQPSKDDVIDAEFHEIEEPKALEPPEVKLNLDADAARYCAKEDPDIIIRTWY